MALALGYNALNLATTAAFNVAVGYQAMDSMTTGFGYSTAVGYQALGGATTGYGNTALGHTALSGVISGNNNTAIGRGAGSSVTDSSCVIIGHDAGRKAGEGSISIGADSLTSLSLATSAVAVGQNTLKALTTGAGNTAVGQDGLILTTTGAQNTSLGKSAGYRITTGTGNTMIGSDAGATAGPATTNYNTFVGYYSGRFTPGANNTLIGYKAGYGVSGSTTTAAEYMVAVGEHALTGITTGSSNTAVGGYAGSGTTSGSSNTYLGYGAGDALTTGSNNTIIGNGSDASSATVSNEITLGNASVTSFRIPGVSFYNLSGNVGIGTASPAKQLTITKSALATINALTDGATITPDFDAGQNFSVTLAGNRTLANPTNIDAGQTGSIFITQDGTGSRTLSFGSYWDFAGGTAPTLSTAAASVDRIDYIVRTGTSIHAVATLNLS